MIGPETLVLVDKTVVSKEESNNMAVPIESLFACPLEVNASGQEEELKKYCKINITEESMLDINVSHKKYLLLWIRNRILNVIQSFRLWKHQEYYATIKVQAKITT